MNAPKNRAPKNRAPKDRAPPAQARPDAARANVLPFPSHRVKAAVDPCEAPCRILIFTGIRYERHDSASRRRPLGGPRHKRRS